MKQVGLRAWQTLGWQRGGGGEAGEGLAVGLAGFSLLLAYGCCAGEAEHRACTLGPCSLVFFQKGEMDVGVG